MEQVREEFKKKYNISNVFLLSDFSLKRKKINLFYSKKENVSYFIYTDGSLEHLDTWIDKKPWENDLFLKNCGRVKRFELLIEQANFLLIDKKYNDAVERDFYINDDGNYINENNIYQVLINEKENLKIKRLGK